MTRNSVYILLLLSFCFSGSAQELVFSNIGSEIQLPSQECYKIHQDKQGYIWFSTDNGLCRYGNGSLQIFDKQNGLPEESVYNISEDSSGKLWFATSENRILYFEKNKLLEAPFSNQYNQVAVGIWAHPTPLLLDMSDPVNFYITNSNYASQIKQSTNKFDLIKPIDSFGSSIEFLKKKNHPLLLTKRNSKQIRDFFSITLSNELKSVQIILPELPVEKSVHWNTPTVFIGKIDFLGVQDKLLKINSDLSFSSIDFPGRILCLYVDQDNGLWVGTESNGLYYYPDITTMKLKHHSLTHFSITGICEDRENGIWCTSLEKGVFFSKNKNLISYTSFEGLNKNLSLLKHEAGKLFASSSGQKIFRWINGKQTIYSYPFNEVRFTDILRETDQWLITGKEMMFRADNQLRFKNQLKQLPNHSVICDQLVFGTNNQIYGILNKNLIEISDSKTVKPLFYNTLHNFKTIIHKSGNVFLTGGDQGLYELNVLTLKSKKTHGIPEKVRKIIQTRSGRIWIATKNNGIYWIDKGKVTNATKTLQLKTLLFYDLTEDPNGTIWAGSNQGLYEFIPKGKGYQTTLYTISHGLPSNEVYKVAADDHKIWFSTFEGLFNLPLSLSSLNNTGPEIHLQKVSVKNKVIPNRDNTFQFPYNQNDFRFTFDILTFKNGTDTQLEYHLKHANQSTVTKLKGNELFLENLNPGNYQLIVYGINNDGVRSPSPEIFLIGIEAPFWLTWWFIALTALIVLLGVFLIIRLIVRSIRKKEEAKTLVNKLIAEYQITALQAQMNPHFIFNAINTIQGYILEKSEEEAYDYLAKFGKLIRAVLHHSQEKVLLLEHELEVLNLYIELEQLRFDHCFDYELTLSENVSPEEIYLPGMILQPYVENAIWHGIVNLRGSRRGKLEVLMKYENQVLTATIKDNGIGREKAMSFNKDRRHKSVGMQLTGERITIMNQLHGYETASVSITDLFDENGVPAGTSVEVHIPINTEV